MSGPSGQWWPGLNSERTRTPRAQPARFHAVALRWEAGGYRLIVHGPPGAGALLDVTALAEAAVLVPATASTYLAAAGWQPVERWRRFGDQGWTCLVERAG